MPSSFDSPIDWEDGYILPPTNPGLGVELDEVVAESPSVY